MKKQIVYVDIKRAEKAKVEAEMKKAGYKKTADREDYMNFDKVVGIMIFRTCFEYED